MEGISDKPTQNEPNVMTRGQRLAAQYAKKAEQRALDKGESDVFAQTTFHALHKMRKGFNDWIAGRQKILVIVGVGLCLAIGLVIGLYSSQTKSQHKTSQWLGKAFEARLEATPAAGASEKAFQKAKASAKGDLLSVTELAQAFEQLENSKWVEAEKGFKAILSKQPDSWMVLQAQEGLGFAFEGQKKYQAAEAEFAKLEKLEIFGVSAEYLKGLSGYHKARMLEAQGKRSEAIALLKQNAESLEKAKDKTFTKALIAQVGQLRALLDKDAPIADQGGGGLDGMDPVRLQQLLRQLQQQQAPQ